ncbi:MAG: AI-2E family transporter [bacterium]|nr:AI-2E family transporter [bacterium]
MLKKEKKEEKVDISKLNDVIGISRTILKISLGLIIIGVILLLTYLFKEWKILDFLSAIFKVISPLFIGIVVAWLLDPIVTWLQKNGIKRAFATIVVFLSFISIIILFLILMIPSLLDQVNEFISSAPSILNYVSDTFNNLFSKLSNIYSYDFTTVKDELYNTLTNLMASVTVGLPNILISFASSIISGGLNIIFGLFVAFYMLFDFNSIRKHILGLLPKKFHNDAITLTDNLNSTLKNYVEGTLIITILLFIVQSFAFFIVGLSSPMLFGLFCAVTNVIPYVGPYIGAVPAIIVGFTISPVVGLGVLVAVILIQLLESYFLNPIVMSKTMKLHPVTIMIGLLVFGHFFGILGMIFATPIISCLKIIINFFNEKYEILDKINNK